MTVEEIFMSMTNEFARKVIRVLSAEESDVQIAAIEEMTKEEMFAFKQILELTIKKRQKEGVA